MAGKIVSILAGLGAYKVFGCSAGGWGIQGTSALLALLLAALMILAFAIRGGAGSDLLLVCFLLFYLNEVFPARYRGWACGALGSVAYLTKAYAFPLFLVHFFLTTVLHWFELTDWPSRRVLWTNFLAGLIIFVGLMTVFATSGTKSYTWRNASDCGQFVLGA